MKIAICLLLLCVYSRAGMVVATVGDSFADALYLAMKVRPDLLKQHEITLVRWSRAKIGFTRLDLFDYPGWLRDNDALGQADLCVVQIGSNDLQSIRTGKNAWAFFGSDAWKELYATRVAGMLATLQQKRCKQIAWFLQPGFENHPSMARGRAPVNQVQAKVVAPTAAVVVEVVTGKDDYQADHVHYGRELMLRIGPALLEMADTARELTDGKCLSCHNPSIAEQTFRAREKQPLRVHGRQ
ncbi:MAG TPA: hypothetical protein VGP79_02280 [Bryobacteraceae bacterium]|nr:hypothetical protein [Bryobacteraceae bacterium]